jgi:hypothetical protein
MKSFKSYHSDRSYLPENTNPFILSRLLKVKLPDDEFTALVVKVEQNAAALLVVDPDHPDCMSVINSKSLPSDTEYVIINQRHIPNQSYFFQNPHSDKIKRVEYHDPKKLNEDEVLDEEIERSAVLYFQSAYRRLKQRDATHDKLNLILEILLTDADDYRNRFM